MKIKFTDFLNESVEYKEKPKIFSATYYRLPNENDLIDINKYNLSSEEILKGFWYTIVGRGIMSLENKNMIIQSINLLWQMYPSNEEYKKALINAKNIKSRWIK